ncbi:MAG TPA: hypothetical protein VGQ38_12655 [Gaiellaceae bacterium]|nr:hypothetical protein [Gaiellaceae bacterium]
MDLGSPVTLLAGELLQRRHAYRGARCGRRRRAAYGGTSLHDQSHGESFLSLITHRFRSNGLYLLDEPEAALSMRGCLALMRRMHDLVSEGSQFIVATHSPIILGYPDSRIYVLSETGIAESEYEATEQYELTHSFLSNRKRFLHYLFSDG